MKQGRPVLKNAILKQNKTKQIKWEKEWEGWKHKNIIIKKPGLSSTKAHCRK